MARTTSAKGKKQSQTTGRLTWPLLEPLVKIIDFNTNTNISLPVFPAVKGQLVILLALIPAGYSAPTDVEPSSLHFAPIPGPDEQGYQVYAGALTASPGYHQFHVKSIGGQNGDTKTASGSIEVSGGPEEDKQLRGQRRSAVRQRASRSTRR